MWSYGTVCSSRKEYSLSGVKKSGRNNSSGITSSSNMIDQGPRSSKYIDTSIRSVSDDYLATQERVRNLLVSADLAAPEELPATRMAAAVFALGVLRQYDTQLVPALEAASGQLLRRSAFTANQLGQIALGFTHLDHRPDPDWQQNFINRCQGHLSSMKGNQLASLAGFLMQLLCHASDTCTMDLLWHLLSCRRASRTALSCSEIALVVATLAQLKVKPYKAWVYDLCARLRVEANSFSAGELVAVVEGLAVLKIALDPEVMHLFVLGIKRWMPVLGLKELDRLAVGIRKMYPKVLPGRTVHQLVDELERRSNFLQLQQSC
eukprot:gene8811-8990_t